MNNGRFAVLVGLVRDFVAALVGLAILFNAPITEDQKTGITLVVLTALALGTWVYRSFRAS